MIGAAKGPEIVILKVDPPGNFKIFTTHMAHNLSHDPNLSKHSAALASREDMFFAQLT